MPLISAEDNVAISRDLIWSEVSGQIVVLDIATGVYYGVDGVGYTIWTYLQEPRTVGDVIDHLIGIYEVSPEVCRQHTLAFIEDMAAKHLILIDRHAVA